MRLRHPVVVAKRKHRTCPRAMLVMLPRAYRPLSIIALCFEGAKKNVDARKQTALPSALVGMLQRPQCRAIFGMRLKRLRYNCLSDLIRHTPLFFAVVMQGADVVAQWSGTGAGAAELHGYAGAFAQAEPRDLPSG